MKTKPWGLFTLSQLLLCFLAGCSEENKLEGGQKIIGHPSGNYLYLDESHEYDFVDMQIDTTLDSMGIRELLYVPVYSDIYIRSKDMRLPLTSTLTIRNISIDEAIFIAAVDYFDSNGNLLNNYLNRTIQLAPLQSIWLVVDDKRFEGGIGANFLVDWGSDIDCPRPFVETLMTGSSYQLGLSFKSESMVSKSWCRGVEVKTADTDRQTHKLNLP